MPIYEYECKHCLSRFEIKKRFSEDAGSLCTQCGREAHRIFSPVSLVFKGSGFYVTDNQKSSDSDAALIKRLSEKGKISKPE